MKKPNILYIMTDQHRLSGVGCYGETVCRTPHIDRLAAEGLLFENAYTASPVCTPARASLMTGLFPHAHGMCCNTHNIGCSVHELLDKPRLLPRQLEKLGYNLGYTGKWHLGGAKQEKYQTFLDEGHASLPRDIGFVGMNVPGHGDGGHEAQEYLDYLDRHGWKAPLATSWEEGLIGRCGILDCDERMTVPYFLADYTNSLIDQFAESDQPFFISHNFWMPHEPYYVPREYYDLYRDVEIPAWPNFEWEPECENMPSRVKSNPGPPLSWSVWQEALRYYYASATLVDKQIGRMIAHLESRGLLENTVVIFTADHGETLGSHGGLTDKGFHHFEETHHIPLIMRLPEDFHARQALARGSRVETIVSLIDYYPTLLELAGGNPKEAGSPKCHGTSLLPLVEGRTDEHPNEAFTQFFGVNYLMATMFTLRKGHLKFGWNGVGRDELYDLEKDPYETTNRIDDPDYQAQRRDLTLRMYDWMRETENPVLHYFRKAVVQDFL